ncbi:MAG: lytic transglycosylase domain-containing protein [Massilia sp.]|nr:lytic transglycosylase domain-containing protein [Massilia sp.]
MSRQSRQSRQHRPPRCCCNQRKVSSVDAGTIATKRHNGRFCTFKISKGNGMVSLRAVVICLQILGVVSLALVLYVWRHPASLSRWRGADQPEHVRAQGLRPEEKTDQAVASTAATTSLAPVRVSKSQADQALWLGAKYRVAPEAVEILLVEADRLSTLHRLSPHLLIAVMAIESNFHPFIESEAGAQGLMQVMPRIHAKRYDRIGGKSIDPIDNLQVGAEILRDCVKLKDGSEVEGLRYYFGGGASSDAYIDKVRYEQNRLKQVAAGVRVPVK